MIQCAHTFELAAEFGGKARNLLQDVGAEVFGVDVDPKQSARHEWGIEGRKGGLTAAGVNGPILGKGAHLLLVDDPVKNADEAQSEAYQRSFRDWFLSTAMSRLEPGGVAIVCAARWTDADPIGWLLAEQAGWEWINCPALPPRTTRLAASRGKHLAGALAGSRTEREEARPGSRWFAAAHQGDPQEAGGAIFERSGSRRLKANCRRA